MPQTAKIVHAVALGLVAVNVILLMTPAALHRLSYGGADSPRFLRTASALVTAAPLFLAAGIAAESYVVLGRIANRELAATCATASFLVLVGFWYALPLIVRWTRHQRKA